MEIIAKIIICFVGVFIAGAGGYHAKSDDGSFGIFGFLFAMAFALTLVGALL